MTTLTKYGTNEVLYLNTGRLAYKKPYRTYEVEVYLVLFFCPKINCVPKNTPRRYHRTLRPYSSKALWGTINELKQGW